MERICRITWVVAAAIISPALLAAGVTLCAPRLPVITTPLGIKMVRIPGGEFWMGSNSGRPDERPAHKVRVSSFYMDICLVTQKQYKRLMGSNPSRWKNPNNPVEQVRWSDAVRYLNARSKAEGLEPCYNLRTWQCDFSANGYRLPTEAEWEYACRAGTRTKYFFGNSPTKLGLYAWYKSNSGSKPRPVAQKLPNLWGLYDMYGNLFEWCNDWYSRNYYKHSPRDNPRGPSTGTEKVLRGGCWDSNASQCTSTYRHKANPGFADVCFGYDIYGFRAVRRAQ